MRARLKLAFEWYGIDTMIRDLRKFRKKAIPYAIRNALNTSAFEARKEWQGEIRKSFILRNRFTEGSIRVEKASGNDPHSMRAVVGSVAPYMRVQEEGGVVRANKRFKPIPTPAAAGQSGVVRTKKIRSANRLSAIQVRSSSGARTRRAIAQRWAANIAEANRKGRRFVLLDRPNGGKGIYRVTPGKRKTRLRLLWDVSKKSVRVPEEPTLQRALQSIQPRLPRIYRNALLYELRRHRISWY